MQPVLIVEDSNLFASLLAQRVQARLGLQTERAKDLSETKERLETRQGGYFAALLDLNLPDAPNGEVVDLVTRHNVPSIIFTGSFNDEVRDIIWSKQIVDYVVKESPQTVEYIVDLLERLRRNRCIKAMVVDDSRTARQLIGSLLRVHQFQVVEAASAQAGLAMLEQHPDTKLLITDYNMPGMDGFEFTKAVRVKFPKNRLAIIGVSAHGGNVLSARFLKSGANDYLTKPFTSEELYCRVTHNVELLEHMETIQRLSDTDPLTGLSNRRYFFEIASKLLAQSRREDLPCCVAMLDVDFFKKINDSYGHDGGDAVLRHLGAILRRRFRESDVVARMGGEEFCVFAASMDPDYAVEIFETVRKTVEKTPILVGKRMIECTLSIGLCRDRQDSLDAMIKAADEKLYEAKQTGRNKVVG
ncbi:diguanylate cyclase [Megalodesulfovibrio paquesii]